MHACLMTYTPHSVRIQEYDSAWPERYRALAERVRTTLGNVVVGVEHVGSTSVPGLAAKPVIDLDVVVQAQDMPRAIQRLTTIGYVHLGNLGIEGREAFRWPPGEERHHLYLCVPESPGMRDHLLFRDYLRAHKEVARGYERHKRALAEQYRDDRNAYQEAKSAFIEAITRRAEKSASPKDNS
jgi:GrpB-like predicted nucleotidyltransferase (UPF0157 family)